MLLAVVLVVFDGAMMVAVAETVVVAVEVAGEMEFVAFVAAVGLETDDAYVLDRIFLDSTGTLDAESFSMVSSSSSGNTIVLLAALECKEESRLKRSILV